VGLNKTPSDKGQQPKQFVDQDSKAHALVQWVEQAGNGDFGVAVVLPAATGYAEDKLNHLIVAPAASGKALTYLVGGAWNRAGEITTREQWRAYVANAAARYNSPIRVSLQAN
jgi:pectinesterase